MKPFSRKMEQEADYIGLLLMAKACYEPREAIELWKRMEHVDKSSSQDLKIPDQFKFSERRRRRKKSVVFFCKCLYEKTNFT